MIIIIGGFMRGYHPGFHKPLKWGSLWSWLVLAWLGMHACLSVAEPSALAGQWYEATGSSFNQVAHDKDNTGLTPVLHPASSGGHFLYKADFELPTSAHYVIDFKSSSVIGKFTHRIYDAQGKLLSTLHGGIQSQEPNPYILRHGRDMMLPAGHYRLVSELESPFFLAHPEPYLATLKTYQQSIKPGNAMVLLCYGAMFILMIYYSALGYVRKQVTDYMYALFIFGNLFYNGMALLILPDLVGIHWFYLISFPILFSNIAYILFVTHLLGINQQKYSMLYRVGRWIIYAMVIFIPVSILWPHWSLEFDRYGVGLIMLYGLIAGIRRAWRGHLIAKYYLVAVMAFFVIGSYSISNAQVHGSNTIYIEHFGMLAVTVEMVLLALVLARQFALLHHEKEHALTLSEHHLQIAHTDALTSLPNRYALDQQLDMLPPEGVLVFIDIDGLKFYNDNFGHKRGDELLCGFSQAVQEAMGETGVLHRIGGDEFAITSASGNVSQLESRLQAAMKVLHTRGFEFSGMSYGIAHAMESRDGNVLKYLADTRMYAHKRERQRGMPQFSRKITTQT
ncbi:GGDEF domain-containing protein [Methylobacillus gramineus]|uniref:sensor domain-containing diguanylate cyclase n=1 Tax=Methylobacillus gramineus TaxID=755169 RepID=UPI001CFF96E5|nr:diguanylate cyclase [Methylobacillus gramineus]MCB5183907.1 GGDEF domain-containing protein [Methylobacillus gramineus]